MSIVVLPCDISVLQLFHVEQLQTPLDEVYQRKKNNVVVEAVPGKNAIACCR